MTDAQRHARSKAVFLKLLAAPEHERESMLEGECDGDADLLREVRSLLDHAAAEPDGILASDSAAAGVLAGPDDELHEAARFASGEVFAGRYRIIAQVGRGSMGEVYRALDLTLQVEVALKILRRSSPATIALLLDEVRLAREITHPAICRIYDVGEADGEYFFSMELVDGEDLTSLLARIGRLPSEKVRGIGSQILRGLAAAHACGVLHRDLKPSNVMLDGNGAVRITDFGIAIRGAQGPRAPLAGTPAYMAPEQLEAGAPPSVQTDLYAVGLVLRDALYGMGHAPDRSARGGRDESLEGVIADLLATDPTARPGSADEAAARLEASSAVEPRAQDVSRRRRWRGAFVAGAAALTIAAAGLVAFYRGRGSTDHGAIVGEVEELVGTRLERSEVGIAVLPVTDETRGRDQSPLGEAIQDGLIEQLSRVRGLRVIAEESADRAQANAGPKAVGHELDVEFVAVGRLTGQGDQLELEVALHDARTGTRMWSDTQPQIMTPPAPVGSEQVIAKHIAQTLRVDEGGFERTVSTGPRDPEARSLYLRGREHVPPYSEGEFRSSTSLLAQAIERAPDLAGAHSAMALAYATAVMSGWITAEEGYPAARRYAARALELDATLAEAHTVVAIVAGEYDWDWPAAERSYQRALELSSSFALAHRSYARYLSSQGRIEEALASSKRALELDPTSPIMLQGIAQRFYEARRYGEAATLARLAIRIDPLYPHSYATLGFALLEQGDEREAISQFRRSLATTGESASAHARLAYAYGRMGDRANADASSAAARDLGVPDAESRVLLALAVGNEAEALTALSGAVDAHDPISIWLAIRPIFDPLRDLAGFRDLIGRVGLSLAAGPDLGPAASVNG